MENEIMENEIMETPPKNIKKKIKTPEMIVEMPTIKNYTHFFNKKNTLLQLKSICRHYKLKASGNKDQLTNTIYNLLHRTYNAIIIQRVWKRYCYKKYHLLHGPARYNRKKCVNETDFYTMDSILSIPYSQFFSFKDKDDMIYGFDVVSLEEFIYNDNVSLNNEKTNPYNRNVFTEEVKRDINLFFKYSNFINKTIKPFINDLPPKLDPRELIKLRTKNLFYEIDNLGNYTNYEWFFNLNRVSLIKFIKELYDIWNYRANIEYITKNDICPPLGNPFMGIDINNLFEYPIEAVKIYSLRIMEQMIKIGINRESRCLGCNYVLCALTLVNTDAAEALPWLFFSVANN
jgi:hypothetical protein